MKEKKTKKRNILMALIAIFLIGIAISAVAITLAAYLPATSVADSNGTPITIKVPGTR